MLFEVALTIGKTLLTAFVIDITLFWDEQALAGQASSSQVTFDVRQWSS